MDKNRPIKVSIAMTTYNGEKYIRQQLGSILSQTLLPDEVIICDDGSTDLTASIIQKFIEENELSNWHLSVNTHNLGFIENFHLAISKTTGSVIFLCDQDDIWFQDKITAMVGKLRENTPVKVLNSGFQKIDEYGEPIHTKMRFGRSNNNLISRKLKPEELVPFELNEIIWRNISPGCTLAFTEEVKDFYLQHHTGLCPHDWEINIFGAVLGGLYFYNEALTGYRIHGGNTLGMADLKLTERLTGNASDKRIALAAQETQRAEAYMNAIWAAGLNKGQQKALRHFHRSANGRFEAMDSKRLGCWLRLLAHPRDYLQLRGPQGIINDFLAVLRKSV